MEKSIKQFLTITTKKLDMIEKKIQEMKFNIIVMSFYSDLKLIEETMLTYQSQGIEIDESLFEKIQKFKILLQSNRNLSVLGKKFIEVTEEFYKLRKQIHGSDNSTEKKSKGKVKQDLANEQKKRGIDFLSAYV